MHRDSSYVNYYFLNIYDAFRQCDTTEEGGSSLTRVLSCERDAIKSIIAIVYESLHVPSNGGERELHPRPRFLKSFRRTILASITDASGCTMSALTPHSASLSPPGMAAGP